MTRKSSKRKMTEEEYYDSHGILKEILAEGIEMSLEAALRQEILEGKRKRKLRNVSIKIDPLYLQSIRKIATKKGIPYQTLVRLWLTEKVRKELKLA
ncbi:BrnA antitoxin family protein [bacterium]|nr:BrnA antitoxin family protein [bacterium]MCI0604898.1 BrnA antitoxin family protein [bacterium]